MAREPITVAREPITVVGKLYPGWDGRLYPGWDGRLYPGWYVPSLYASLYTP